MDTNTDFNLPLSIAITNAAGAPATVEGKPVWASSDETVLRVENLSADAMSGTVVTVAPGVARITVTADADLGAGTAVITGISEDVNVTQGPSSTATTIKFTFGAPVPKTPATP